MTTYKHGNFSPFSQDCYKTPDLSCSQIQYGSDSSSNSSNEEDSSLIDAIDPHGLIGNFNFQIEAIYIKKLKEKTLDGFAFYTSYKMLNKYKLT